METIIVVNFFVFMLVGTICVFIGLDLKKWSSGLLGLYGFLTGSLVGLLSPGESLSLDVGALLAIAVLYVGAMVRRNKQIYTKEEYETIKNNYDNLVAGTKKSREEKAKRNK